MRSGEMLLGSWLVSTTRCSGWLKRSPKFRRIWWRGRMESA